MEATDLAMVFNILYARAGEHGLLVLVVSMAEYLADTGKNYVPLARPSTTDPRIFLRNGSHSFALWQIFKNFITVL